MTNESKRDYDLVREDVRDEDAIRKYVVDAKFIFHQAHKHTDERRGPWESMGLTVNGTHNVLEAARSSDTECIVVNHSSRYSQRQDSATPAA